MGEVEGSSVNEAGCAQKEPEGRHDGDGQAVDGVRTRRLVYHFRPNNGCTPIDRLAVALESEEISHLALLQVTSRRGG